MRMLLVVALLATVGTAQPSFARTWGETRQMVEVLSETVSETVHQQWYGKPLNAINPFLGQIDPQGGSYFLRDFAAALKAKGLCTKTLRVTGINSSVKRSQFTTIMTDAIVDGSVSREVNGLPVRVQCK